MLAACLVHQCCGTVQLSFKKAARFSVACQGSRHQVFGILGRSCADTINTDDAHGFIKLACIQHVYATVVVKT